MNIIRRYMACSALALLPLAGAEAAEVWTEAESFSAKRGMGGGPAVYRLHGFELPYGTWHG